MMPHTIPAGPSQYSLVPGPSAGTAGLALEAIGRGRADEAESPTEKARELGNEMFNRCNVEHTNLL